jgi:hypothetical protein
MATVAIAQARSRHRRPGPIVRRGRRRSGQGHARCRNRPRARSGVHLYPAIRGLQEPTPALRRPSNPFLLSLCHRQKFAGDVPALSRPKAVRARGTARPPIAACAREPQCAMDSGLQTVFLIDEAGNSLADPVFRRCGRGRVFGRRGSLPA